MRAEQRFEDPSARKRDRPLRSGHLLAERRSRLLPALLTELDEWLNFVPALHAAYWERLADIWDNRNRAGARSALEDWIKTLPAEIVLAFRPVLTALNDWKAEILASWDRKIEDTYVNAADDVLNARLERTLRLRHGPFTHPDHAGGPDQVYVWRMSRGIPNRAPEPQQTI
ncbi:transposase [Bradyrhizobium sp. WYCCWR 13022]|uniref:transposase n=1 Tax=unclassified Bradyrhizobium TaxID=2631580 RepID=UPI00263A6174|nr:transposase [Bradyrhizobium sp. WYCCWR 13022]MDN4985571.1 transposase [Bradyrhizobium sp. WYCCWR 13022]